MAQQWIVLFLAFQIIFAIAKPKCLPENPQPVIGILTQPTDDNQMVYGDQYVVASYVKWIESSGARAYFVYYDASQDDLRTLLTTQLNGLLFPGGDADIVNGKFAETSKFLLSLVMEINLKADYFPLWATCQGFQQVSIYSADDASILIERTAENILYPLNFTEDASIARLLLGASDDIIATLTYENSTVNSHHYGVDPVAYATNSYLFNNYSVLATNMDINGNEFVSLIEGRSFPIYAAQFHPEKNAYEWDQAWSTDPDSHTPDSIDAMQYFGDYIIREARKSQHKFTGGLSTAGCSVYSVTPTYTGNLDPYWEQTYFFWDHNTTTLATPTKAVL